VLIYSFETLDLSAIYTRPVGDRQIRLRSYGTNVLDDGRRNARLFYAGSFAFADIVPRRTLGATMGYEF